MNKRSSLLSFFVVMFLSGVAVAELSLPAVFGHHMVLQRDQPMPVWGQAAAGQAVTVQLLRGDDPLPLVQAFTEADEAGAWRVDLEAQPAGGPYRLVVRGGTLIEFMDVYVGEVWLCGGQSNMEWPVRLSDNAEAEMAAANDPLIRHFNVPRTVAAVALTDTDASWTVASPETVGGYTAVGYYFARELRNRLGVPVGLVNSTWGGTRIEPWISPAGLEAFPGLAEQAADVTEKAMAFTGTEEEARAQVEREQAAYSQAVAKRRRMVIEGGRGLAEGWAEPGHDVSDWLILEVPGHWEDAGIEALHGFDGVVWYRRTFDVPASWVGRDLVLELGGIDDIDDTYINGVEVGSTGFDVGDHWRTPRVYRVPGALIDGREVTLAIRVGDWYYAGGFNGSAALIRARLADSEDVSVPLAGSWRVRIDEAAEVGPMPQAPASPALGGATHRTPAALYRGMIHPVVPYGLRGAIWYQGESNAAEAEAYRDLLPAMIDDWRAVFEREALPFGVVQLANFREASQVPVESGWAELRDAQLATAKAVDGVGLAVTIDIGDADDIHPRNKQDVGSRLARWAMAEAYGQPGTGYSGPMFDRAFFLEDRVVVTFSLFGSRPAVRGGGDLGGFALAGPDGVWHWAQARIEGDRVEVWSDAVEEPVAVRYGWADNPVRANLVNTEWLPASPFMTQKPAADEGG
ncbi:sialate O-acetylesterase [Mucisphaera sp.]|uniref:sialate O-acetylesterase n=1 Tax=Mucisphaera sp. TaxID=2913024 RepID=UPI003D09A7F4